MGRARRPSTARSGHRAGPIALLLALCLGATAEGAFAYRKPLTIQGARVSGAPHANFPILVSLVDPNLRTTANGGRVRSASGYDLAFMLQSTGALLDHEIERYDGATGTLVAWVRIPSLTAVNSTIFVYYGDLEITCAQTNPSNVWDANFRMVQHLEETAGPHLDSTSNNNGSVVVDVAAQGSAVGQINGTDQFSAASTDNVDVGDSPSLDLTAADSLTAEAWVRTASAGFQFVVNKKQDPAIRDWQVHVDASGFAAFWMADGSLPADRLQANSATVVNDNNWHYLVGRWDRATGLGEIFVDGLSVASAIHAYGDLSNGNPLVIGEEGDSNRGSNFDGRIDEVRISNVVRTAGWITTTFNNASCPSTSTCGVPANRFVVEGAEQVVPTNYRSIGDTTTPYSTGSVTAAIGSATVFGTGTAWRTANRGRGDTITFGAFTGTILSVDSETQLTLVSPSTVTGPFAVYAINRKFSTLATWETCIDGGGSSCGPDPAVGSTSLITDDRREVGVVYKDKVYVDEVLPLDNVLVINGSTTGPFHTITVTADPGNRHNGIPASGGGSGVVLDMSGATGGDAISVSDDFVTVEWMEARNAGVGADAFEITGVGGPGIPNKVVIRNCIAHGVTKGIDPQGTDVNFDIYNNFLYQNTEGLRLQDVLNVGSNMRILNNTVFNNTARGIWSNVVQVNPTATLRNNIAHSNGVDFNVTAAGLTAASSDNLSGDATATAHSPGGGDLPGVCLTGPGCVNFISTILGAENLHLRTTAPLSAAQDAGVNLSCFLQRDIDGVARLNPWEIGADDVSQTTAVELQSFAASGVDTAVTLTWVTASELQNLGFHLYRAASAEGPFERITSSLIPGLGSSPTGASYSYRDGGLSNGQTYYYELEDVETTGGTKRHGPVLVTVGTPGGGGGGEDCNCSSGGGDGSGSQDGDSDSGSTTRITYGQPEARSFRIVERGASHVLLELVTPGFYAVPEEEGTVRLEIPGFESRSVPGAPAVPVLRTYVEAVAGRRVRLSSVVAREEVRFDGLRVATAEGPAIVVTETGMVRAGRVKKQAAVRRGFFPRTWSQLLGVSFQGETKKVQVELSPLRYDSRTGTTVLAGRLLVRLDFVGVERGERGLGGSRGRRPRPVPGLKTSGRVAELVTKEAGLYALRFEDVLGGRRGVPSSSLRLSYQGQGVAYHLEPPRALFGPGSVLYFVSEGGASNPWGDAVYTLETGQAGVVMATLGGSPSGPATLEYLDLKEWEENRFYQAGLLDAPDLWQWDLLVSPVTKSYPFTVSQLSSSSTAAHLRVWLQGASDFEADPDHHLRVLVNGTPVGEASWDAKTERVIEAEVLPGILQEGANTLSLESVGDTAAAYSMVFLNRFSLRYPRLLVAENGQVQGSFGESGTAEVSGLDAPAFVVDTQEQPKWLRGLLPTAGGVSFRAEGGRSYLVASSSALRTPTVRRPVASRLRSSSNRADWVLIGPKELLAVAQPLIDLRRSQGLEVKVVSVEEVYQEFGYGESRPEAVKGFLEYAYQSWRRPSLRYVVLLGDGTYDPKDYLKTGVKDRIPPYIVKTSYLWTASDPAYGAVNGEDLLPDVAVGRLSAGTVEEARVLVDKIVAFETGGRTLFGKAVLIADNADLAGSFEADADEIAASVLSQREVEKVYLRDLQGGTRATIVAAFDSGPGLVSYMGHGGTAVWASENVFNNTDVASLSAQGQQPLLLTLNCLNGFFHFPPFDSLAEAFLKAEGKGAVAAFSPSGLSLNDAAHVYHQAVLAEIESGRHSRLGDAILAAQSTYADSGAFPELLSIYHLFGDPALRMR